MNGVAQHFAVQPVLGLEVIVYCRLIDVTPYPPKSRSSHGPKFSRSTREICAMIAVRQSPDAAAAAYGACADAAARPAGPAEFVSGSKSAVSACARGSRDRVSRNGEIAMKLIDVAPAARVIIVAMICAVAGRCERAGNRKCSGGSPVGA